MRQRIGLGQTRTARRIFPALGFFLLSVFGGQAQEDGATVQPLDAASRSAVSEVAPASPDAAIAPQPAGQPQKTEEGEKKERRKLFSGRKSREDESQPTGSGIDPETGLRYLPSFSFDPGQVDPNAPISESGEPSMLSPAGKTLQQFQPSGPPGMGRVEPKPAPEPKPERRPGRPKKEELNPLEAAVKGETAFNPKFGPPQFEPELDPSMVQEGELATSSGANLKQFTPTGPSEFGPDAKPKPAPKQKPAAAEVDGEASKLAKRNDDWMSSGEARPLPKLDMESLEPTAEQVGEAGAMAQLTQFTPTGPPPNLEEKKPAARPKRAREGETPDPDAAKRAEFAKYFETEQKKPLPTLEVDFGENYGMVSDVSAAEGPYTELAAMGPTLAGKPLKHFEAIPPEVPIQLRPDEVEPDDRRGRGRKQKTEPAEDPRSGYDEFYGMDSKFAMPTLEAPAEVWEEGDKIYITGAPKTASGKPLTPFGEASAPGIHVRPRRGGFLPGRQGEYEVDFTNMAEADRRGADSVLAEVGPPVQEEPQPVVEVVAAEPDAPTFQPPVQEEPQPVVEVVAAEPDAPTFQPPGEITGNDLDPEGWPIPETPIEKVAARSVFAVAQRLAGAKPVVGQPSLFPNELLPGGEGEAMPDGDLDLPPGDPETPALDETPIIPELRGIQLASTWRQNQENPAAAEGEQASIEPTGVENVDAGAVAEIGPPQHSTFSDHLTIDSDLEVPDEVQQMFAGQIGQPLSLASLDQMLRDAIAGYQGSDIPVVDISIPEQEITGGVLKLDVLEARLGRTIVEEAETGGPTEHTKPEYLMAQVQTQSGEKLRSSELLKDVEWLNRYPFRRVDLIYAPGQNFGETDVILRAVERRPWLFYTTVDNTGNELLGEYRASAALTVGSPFGNDDHLMAYAYSTDTDLEHLQSHSLAYTLPVYWNKIRPERNERHMLTILGAFADVQSTQIIDGQVLALEGFSGQGSLRYLLPMPRKTGVTREIEFGLDWKASNNNLQFNTLEVFDTTTHIYQASAGYRTRYEKFLGLQGYATFDLDMVFSPGGIDESNSNEVFDSARSGASAQYAYARGAIEWHVPLNDWEVVARLTGQAATTNLLATETLGAGGVDTVRGFDERIIRGDSGFLFSLEALTPEMEVPSFVNWKGEPLNETWQGVFFYEAANLTNVHKLEGEPDWFSAQSAGIGLRYEFNNTFTLEVDYGWVIDASGFDVEEGSRIHVKGQIVR